MEDATLVKHARTEFVLRSIDEEREYRLHGEMLVGREVECAIPLHSGHISRYHAKLNVSPNGVYVEDLHSTNGTYINGRKIKGRVRLSVGDEVAFDDVLFRLASNRSGSAAETQLGRPHNPSTESRVSPFQAKRPSVSAHKQPARDDGDLIDELDDIPVREDRVEPVAPVASIEPVDPVDPEPVEPAAVIEAPKESAAEASKRAEVRNIAPADNLAKAENDRTVMLSTQQINHMMERNLGEKDVAIGTGPRLVVMTAPTRGKVFPLNGTDRKPNWQIGRDSGSQICLSDSTISSDHARLALSPEGGFLLAATHAKNGVYVNGARITKIRLNHNDKIQIGRTELLFKTDSGQPPTRPSNTEVLISSIETHRSTLISTLVVLGVVVMAILISGG